MAQESMKLVSPQMHGDSRMPRKYTADGQGAVKDVSPPLEWYAVPPGAVTLALVVEDIDGLDDPLVPWTHWIVVNIPPSAKGLPEGFSGGNADNLAGVKEGVNDWKVPGWRGPKPPPDGHRIRFRLYALDCELQLGNKVTKEKVLEAVESHVVGEADLIVLF
ncbi:hypothetical protein HPP92_026978 [Vanilla planifolia]|uniref:Phosphatidylethanolamine-binding protein n=1 Tax=Vanilla planifolia TaxID=51239 RepID=A0A835PAV1_VANPL|nr:hypothetical protein HPP92_026978 [Vanilla planifolia]